LNGFEVFAVYRFCSLMSFSLPSHPLSLHSFPIHTSLSQHKHDSEGGIVYHLRGNEKEEMIEKNSEKED
jgi:hypothetical protein